MRRDPILAFVLVFIGFIAVGIFLTHKEVRTSPYEIEYRRP